MTRSGVTGSVVALVGAGPGDPDLLTLRAEALLADAACVVVDRRLAPLAAAFASRASIVAVPDRTPAVDALLQATADHTPVVRLYEGDTWLHPGHGREAAALAAAGIAYEAVAGVATEIGLPGLHGIAVHVRHLAVAVTIVDDPALVPATTDPARTIVIRADDLHVAARAVASIADPSLPAATVDTDGHVTRARLGRLDAPHRPGVLVIGAVAATAHITVGAP